MASAGYGTYPGIFDGTSPGSEEAGVPGTLKACRRVSMPPPPLGYVEEAARPSVGFNQEEVAVLAFASESNNKYYASESTTRPSGGYNPDVMAVRLRNRVQLWEMVLVPWSILVLMLVAYLLGGAYGITFILWLVPIVLVVTSGTFLCLHFKAGNNAEVFLGLLCIGAVIIGLIAGVYAVSHSLQEYHRLTRGASYYNVLPMESAGAKSDATTLAFTNFTYVAVNESFGFVDAINPVPTTYCVAPVTSGLNLNSRVQYWAAGTNCCDHRGNFWCGDAKRDGAHGAIVLPKSSRTLKGFKAAIHGAETAYGLKSGDDYILLNWSLDPLGARDALWANSATFFIIFACVHFVVSVLTGCAVMPAINTKDV